MPLEIRELSPEEAPAVFQACGERPGAVWRWLAASPGGWRCLGLFQGSALRAGVVAVAQRVLANGAEARMAEILAAFESAPRPGLRRGGPYVQVLRSLFEVPPFEVHGPEEHAGRERALAYTWRPSPREWGLAKKLLDCEIVRTETLLVRAVDEGTREPPPAAETPAIESIERFDHQARWLFDRCAGDFGASVIRDDAFLNWRFVDHPVVRYRILGVRDGQGILRGYAALGQTKGVLEIVDWLVPPQESAVGEALLEALLAVAQRSGVLSVRALQPDWAPWFDMFQRRGFRVLDSGRFVAARTFARRLDDLWLRDRWWYTGADFVGPVSSNVGR